MFTITYYWMCLTNFVWECRFAKSSRIKKNCQNWKVFVHSSQHWRRKSEQCIRQMIVLLSFFKKCKNAGQSRIKTKKKVFCHLWKIFCKFCKSYLWSFLSEITEPFFKLKFLSIRVKYPKRIQLKSCCTFDSETFPSFKVKAENH